MTDQDALYVVKLTTLSPRKPFGLPSTTILPATYTSLPAAKATARSLLEDKGYDPEFFTQYDVKTDPETWPHGEGVAVYAKAPSGEVFKVGIDTVPNTTGLEADPASGRVPRPLFHVVQTLIEYARDRSGSEEYTIVQGTYDEPVRAREHAMRVLLDGEVTRGDFVEYDEFGDGGEGPYGPDVVVRAVNEGGENILVAVTAEESDVRD